MARVGRPPGVKEPRPRKTAADLPLDELAELYLMGGSVNALAKRFGVSRTLVSRALQGLGVELRGQVEANRLMMAGRTPEDNARNVAAAHEARRGSTDSFESKCLRAQIREDRCLGTSALELQLQEMLKLRGLATVNQKAVGPYNIDLAAAPVAVEVFGGRWHNFGRHRARFPKRTRYLLDQGWNQVVVWVTADHPLEVPAVDQIVSFVELSRCDPSFRGQHRMIWGDGDVATVRGFELD